MFPKGKKILFAVLDWGLGHAGRSIPLITKLLENNNSLVLAGSGSSCRFLQSEFPQLRVINLPSYQVEFHKVNVITSLVLKIPGFVKVINTEHRLVHNFIEKEKIEIIFSDNRYGCYSKNIHSVLITHQLNILTPKKLEFLSFIPALVNRKLLKNFNEIWVPDTADSLLSGKLSINKNIHPNIKFTGILSRFKKTENITELNEVFAWVSGPEPYRTQLVEILIPQLKDLKIKSTLLIGQPEKIYTKQLGNLTILNHLDTVDFNHKLLSCKYIICRSGYSTLMDLYTLHKKALLIPTPTQIEQEYLAERFSDTLGYKIQEQTNINIEKFISTF